MIKARDTMTFACDIMVCIHNIISTEQYNDQSTGYNDVCL